jgi:crossover junction endodeoxyribonuclease RuvC
MSRVVIGIDPGLDGAIVVCSHDAGEMLSYWDMPIVSVTSTKVRRFVSPHGVRDILAAWLDHDPHVVLEHVEAVQQSGATSAFAFGRGFGTIEGVVAGLRLPYELVRPQAWTKALGVPRDKGAHRLTAMRLWPAQSSAFALVKHDGRADAALLCSWYARRNAGQRVAADQACGRLSTRPRMDARTIASQGP